MHYSVDEQCQILFGTNATFCNEMEVKHFEIFPPPHLGNLHRCAKTEISANSCVRSSPEVFQNLSLNDVQTGEIVKMNSTRNEGAEEESFPKQVGFSCSASIECHPKSQSFSSELYFNTPVQCGHATFICLPPPTAESAYSRI